MYLKYKKDFSKEDPLDKRQYLRVVDNILSKLKDALIFDNQIYKPYGGIGNFLVMKYEPKKKFGAGTRYLLNTGGWIYYLIWRHKQNQVSNFRNWRIYDLKVFPAFHNKLKNHVIKLSQDPYKRDYNAPIST